MRAMLPLARASVLTPLRDVGIAPNYHFQAYIASTPGRLRWARIRAVET
jgi:hypothetical protein